MKLKKKALIVLGVGLVTTVWLTGGAIARKHRCGAMQANDHAVNSVPTDQMNLAEALAQTVEDGDFDIEFPRAGLDLKPADF